MPGYCGQLAIVRLLLSLALISLIPCGMSPPALNSQECFKIKILLLLQQLRLGNGQSCFKLKLLLISSIIKYWGIGENNKIFI